MLTFEGQQTGGAAAIVEKLVVSIQSLLLLKSAVYSNVVN